jgi:LysM repeat protein
MGLYKPSMWLPLLSGAVGATVFSHNAGGHYIRNLAIPVNPSTVRQNFIRNALAGNAQFWRTLSDAQRLQWTAAAPNFPVTDPFGDTHILSGNDLFNQLNTNLINVGLPIITVPPTPQGITNFTSLVLTATNIAVSIAFTATPTPANQLTIVYATRPLSAGIGFFNNEFRQIAVIPITTGSPFVLTGAYNAKFGAPPPTGTRIAVALVPVHTVSGQEGTRITATDIS